MEKEDKQKYNIENKNRIKQQLHSPETLAGSTIEERLAKMWNLNRTSTLKQGKDEETVVTKSVCDVPSSQQHDEFQIEVVNPLDNVKPSVIEAEHVLDDAETKNDSEVMNRMATKETINVNKIDILVAKSVDSLLQSRTSCKRKWLILFSFCAFFLVGGGVYVWYHNTSFHVRSKQVYVELGSEVSLDPNSYVRAKEDVIQAISIDISEVNAKVVGTYPVYVHYEEEKDTISLTIEDTTAPIMHLVDGEIEVYKGKVLKVADVVERVEDYSEAEISFDKEKKITELTFQTVKTEAVYLYVTDMYGNTNSMEVNVQVKEDEQAPRLDGVFDIVVAYGSTFDPLTDVSAIDNADGDISQHITISGSVDTKKEGDYEILYEVSDEANNLTSHKRIISVERDEISDAYSYTSTNDDKTVNIQAQVLTYLKDKADDVGIVYYDIETGNYFSINGGTQFRSASTAKVFAVMYAYEQIAQGKASPSTLLSYNEELHYEGGTGVLQDEDKTKPIALERLLRLAITHSDNIAFHMIVDYFGGANVMDYYESIIGHSSNREINHMSAEDGLALMLHSYASPIFSTMITDLKTTIFNDRISRYLPKDIVAHKIGNFGGNVHDIGIIYAKNPYILSVFSNGLVDAATVEAELSQLIYELHEQ